MAPDEQPAAPPELLASDAERQQATALLKQACVEGRVTLDEFGDRMRRALAARTRGELADLTHDLPPTPAPGPAGRTPVSMTFAALGSAERSGFWRVGEHSRVTSILGSCKLDLRRASVAATRTIIRAQVVMGDLTIVLPEGVEVEAEAVAVLGARTLRLTGPPPPPDAPVVRIEGFVLLGNITVRDHA
jgi:Domain of unknown function (DUF1707)/Cell wall-active antibiotics response 4TMS YvqF